MSDPVASGEGPGRPGEQATRGGSAAPEGASVGSRPSERRRGTHRRATGGTVPNPDRGPGGTGWVPVEREFGAEAPDPRDQGQIGGHEAWLKEQRPPHWG